LGTIDSPQTDGRVRDTDVLIVHVVQDEPVVPLPVNDRGQWHVGEVLRRGLHRARGETELLRAAAERPQARPVGARVEELPVTGQAHGPPEMAADHRYASRPAIHFVDLLDMRESPDPFGLLDETPFLRSERAGTLRTGRL